MPADVFDEERRAWIAARAGIWLSQKRRAELLGKRIRARTRAKIGARPDPHDDQVTPPLAFRSSSTTTGALETATAAAAAILAPVGWAVGKLLYIGLTRLIPERLQAYPTTALAWTAAITAAPLPAFYDPRPTFTSVLIVPWLLAQVPAVFAAAAILGVLEGWLAIDGSTDWWPLAPAPRDIDSDLLLGPWAVPMPTLLDPTTTRADEIPRVPRRRPPPVYWARLAGAAATYLFVSVWYLLGITHQLIAYPARYLETANHTASAAPVECVAGSGSLLTLV